MKKAITISVGLFIAMILLAQSPQKISYQAVIRNSSDQLVTETQIGMQISILQVAVDGSPVYIEKQTPTTNANGLVSIEIGAGITSDDFSAIDWSDGPYFIKTETDPAGGESYTIIGTSQLLSVPYALHAKTAEIVTGEISITETDPLYSASEAANITAVDISNWNAKSDFSGNYIDLNFSPSILDTIIAVLDTSSLILKSEEQGLSEVLVQNNDANNNTISNLGNPTLPQDAVPKSYVDAILARLEALEKEILHGVLIDTRDKKEYEIVKIGSQWWMAENLNVGSMILRPSLQTDNGTFEKYCYENESDSCDKYGGLYIWGEVMGYHIVDSSQGICPDGWHIPSDEEWKELECYLGMTDEEVSLKGYRGNLSQKIKEDGETGFNGIFSGKSYNMGSWYQGVGIETYWWSSTELEVTGWAWIRGISKDQHGILRDNGEAGSLNPPYGDLALPCRCIKN